MPILIALLGIVGTAVFFILRARNAAQAGSELLDVANDVRLAARRFGFRRRTNVHPVESIEVPTLAVAAIATAFLEMDDLPTRDQRDALSAALAATMGLGQEDVQEATVLGHWFVSECGGPVPAVARLSRKLFRLGGSDALPGLLRVIDATVSANGTGMNRAQTEALDDIKRAFRIR